MTTKTRAAAPGPDGLGLTLETISERALALALWDRAHDRIDEAFAAGDDATLFALYRATDALAVELARHGLSVDHLDGIEPGPWRWQ